MKCAAVGLKRQPKVVDTHVPVSQAVLLLTWEISTLLQLIFKVSISETLKLSEWCLQREFTDNAIDQVEKVGSGVRLGNMALAI